MKQTINSFQFSQAFKQMGRGDSFTPSGFNALFSYLTEMEEECDTEFELDPIAFDCEYSEHDNLQTWASDYFSDLDQCLDEMKADRDYFESFEEIDSSFIRDYIHDNGQLIEFEGGIIISSF